MHLRWISNRSGSWPSDKSDLTAVLHLLLKGCARLGWSILYTSLPAVGSRRSYTMIRNGMARLGR